MPKWLCDKLLRGQRTPHAALDDWESTAMRFQYWSAAGVGIPAASFTLRTVACNAGYASGPLAFINLAKVLPTRLPARPARSRIPRARQTSQYRGPGSRDR